MNSVLSEYSWSRLADIQSAAAVRHRGNLLRQGTEIRWTTCTIDLSVVSVQVRRQAVQLNGWNQVSCVHDKH